MFLSRWGLAAMALGLTCATACSSATTPDGGGPVDSAARPDAAPRPDAVVAPDAPPGDPDASNPDAPAVEPDAEADAGVPDAGDPDTGLPDAAPPDPCPPVPRAQAPQQLITSLSAWLGRCNPELTAGEVLAGAAFVAELSVDAFEDINLTYSSTAAGLCGCAIATAPCDVLATLRAIPSCDATLVATSTTGDECTNDFQCPSRHRCQQQIDATATVVAGGGGFPQCFSGFCTPFAAVGESCELVDCEPGTYCTAASGTPICTAKVPPGGACSEQPCIGDYSDVFVLPPNYCYYTKSGATCEPRGRMGASCAEGRVCSDLYNCDVNQVCAPVPGQGDACPTPFDVESPSTDERFQLYTSATFSCRVPTQVGGNRGSFCTQTGTTTGVATCQALPTLGQPCGIGQNLAPACGAGAFCAGLDDYLLAPITSVCVPQLTVGSTCTPPLLQINESCEAGSVCYAQYKSPDFTCTDVCDLGSFPQ